MDYEKKYNEALERAKGILNVNPSRTELGNIMESIFPELRESEDERMRKKTINCLTMHNKGCVDAKDIDECIAWLEKQKGDKDELVYRLNGLMQDYIKEGKDDDEKEHRLKCYQLFWDALEDANFFEQKEQNPAWSEEDKRAIDRACVALRAYSNGDLPEFLPSELLGYADRLQSLRPQPHWKPSKEQMNALLSARFLYRDGLENSATASALESLYVVLENL